MKQVTKKIKGSITCNMCGKNINMKNGIYMEDTFEGYKEWGYFSSKDLEVHKFNMCEKCYDKLIQSFKVPVDIYEKVEVMYPKV